MIETGIGGGPVQYTHLHEYNGNLILPSLKYNGSKRCSNCVAALKKTQQQCFFPEIMTLLLKIIHRPCCEQFHVGRKVVPVSKKVVPT